MLNLASQLTSVYIPHCVRMLQVDLDLGDVLVLQDLRVIPQSGWLLYVCDRGSGTGSDKRIHLLKETSRAPSRQHHPRGGVSLPSLLQQTPHSLWHTQTHKIEVMSS